MSNRATNPHRKVLPYLQSGGSGTSEAIADAMHINRTTATRHLALLESEGYVTIERSGKIVIGTLTDAGWEYRHREVEQCSRIGRKSDNWINPFRGMPYNKRLDAIVERDRQARLAPEYTR